MAESKLFDKIAGSIPEKGIVTARWAIVQWVDEDGMEHIRWDDEGDPDILTSVAAAEAMKFQLLHHSLGECEHGE